MQRAVYVYRICSFFFKKTYVLLYQIMNHLHIQTMQALIAVLKILNFRDIFSIKGKLFIGKFHNIREYPHMSRKPSISNTEDVY